MTDEMDDLDNRFKESAEKFSLIPSINIWKNVEADILNRKRKRRFIIFFFLIAGILTSGIFLFNSDPTNSKTSMQKNNSTLTKQNTVQDNVSTEMNKFADKKNISSQSLPEEYISSNRNDKVIQDKKSLNAVSASAIKNEIASATQNISTQNIVANNPLQTEISATITTTVSPIAIDRVKPSLSTSTDQDTLQSTTKTDSLLATINDIIKQDSVTEKKDSIKTGVTKSKWSIAMGVAPTLSYSKLEEEGDYQFVANYRDSSDKNLLTWNCHFAIHYKLLPEVELFTGIGLINFEQEILSKQVVYKYDTNGIISGPVPLVTIKKKYFNINGDSTGTVKNKFMYLEIPVGIRYNFLPKHKFNIALQPEIAFNKLIQSEGYAYSYQNRTYEKIKSADLNPWLVSYGVGLSFQYAIIQNLCVELTPYYKRFQKSIYKDEYSITQRFQQAELRLSIRCHFK